MLVKKVFLMFEFYEFLAIKLHPIRWLLFTIVVSFFLLNFFFLKNIHIILIYICFWIFGLWIIYTAYYPKYWSHRDEKYQNISHLKTFPKFIQMGFTINITLWFVILFLITLPISVFVCLLIVWISHRKQN